MSSPSSADPTVDWLLQGDPAIRWQTLRERDVGLPRDNAQARAGCTLLLDRGLQSDGGLNFGSAAKRHAAFAGAEQ